MGPKAENRGKVTTGSPSHTLCSPAPRASQNGLPVQQGRVRNDVRGRRRLQKDRARIPGPPRVQVRRHQVCPRRRGEQQEAQGQRQAGAGGRRASFLAPVHRRVLRHRAEGLRQG